MLMSGGEDAAILLKLTSSKVGRRKMEKQARAFS